MFVPAASGRVAMASTNEDAVVLATARRGDDGRLLIIRHLPNR
jgi:hypothetical protein